MSILKNMELNEIDRRIIKATEAGLPLVSEPYMAVAKELGLPLALVMERLQMMLQSGVIRRIAAVPNHYALGVQANGMTVWDVDDAKIAELGARVGQLDFVSHCYRRPRVEGLWDYNLFAMVHGQTRDECLEKAARIRQLLGADCRAHDILFSSRILKKTGFRSQTRTRTAKPHPLTTN